MHMYKKQQLRLSKLDQCLSKTRIITNHTSDVYFEALFKADSTFMRK